MKIVRTRTAAMPVAGMIVGLAVSVPAQADDRYDYGEYLSSECTPCHRLSGDGDGIPAITGWPIDIFVTVMESYREGAQENEAMKSVVKSLSKEDIEALAVFFEKQGQ